MKQAVFLLTIFIASTIPACSFNVGTNTAATSNASNTNSVVTNSNAPARAATPAAETKGVAEPAKCAAFSQPGKRFIANQSFPFDFEPFKGSCFVTFGSKDEMMDDKDVPRGSTFYIYTESKQVAELPDAFGGQKGCWVEAVGFSDLNGDGKTDIVVAGKCLGAKDSYPSNAVYANNGKGFTTDATANEKLEELKTVDAIKAFVKKDVKSFF